VLELDVSPASALPIYRQNQSDHLVGGSLDGCVYGFKGVIELKVPRSATPIGYIKNGGLLACDFASFGNRRARFKSNLRRG
jgi:hypothetical protein